MGSWLDLVQVPEVSLPIPDGSGRFGRSPAKLGPAIHSGSQMRSNPEEMKE